MRKEHCINDVSSYTIWRNYIIGTIALSLVPIIAFTIGNVWIISLVFLFFSLSIFSLVKLNRGCKLETCLLIPFVVARIFLVLTILSIGFNVFLSHGNRDALGEQVYGHITLFYALVAVVMLGIHLKLKLKNRLCADCIARKGNPYERASLGIAYYAEVNYLLKRMLLIYAVILMLSWGLWTIYFLTGKFAQVLLYVCLYTPVVVFVLDGLITGLGRFIAYKYHFDESMKSLKNNEANRKQIRITLISDRAVYYSQKCGETELETPLKLSDNYNVKNSEASIRAYLNHMIGFDSYDVLRLAYITDDASNQCSIEHYMCFVKDESVSKLLEEQTLEIGVWLEKKQLQEAFSQKLFSKMVSSELHRIFIVMQGYKSAQFENHESDNKDFTLMELKTSKVDFSDSKWLLRSDIKGNFFKYFSCLWHRYIEGFN